MLLRNSKVVILDEATSALDPETTTQILELLKQIRDTLNLTILLITATAMQGEVIYNTKSGSSVNVLISTSYLKDATEKTTGILVLARDITLRKKSEEALSKLKSNKYDLLFTDLKMPELTGEELVRTIRADSKNESPMFITKPNNAN